MNRLVIALFCYFIVSAYAFAQNDYKEGYFITTEGERVSCYILDEDWLNNPTGFTYKLTSDGISQKAKFEDFSEFQIEGIAKYKKKEVQIDRASEDVEKLSTYRNPSYQTELLLLQVLIEGDPSLFYFRDSDLVRFFYQIDNNEITQLVYKSYKNKESKIKVNRGYLQQLTTSCNCQNAKVENVQYEVKSLVSYFEKENDCRNVASSTFLDKKKKGGLRLGKAPGMNYSSIDYATTTSRGVIEFPARLSFRLGLELELVLPFNNDKWAMIFEPNYQYYKGEATSNRGNQIEADYKSLELALGMRHYFFLNEQSKIFVNAAYSVDFSLNSLIGPLELTKSTSARDNLNFGIGYNKGKLSAELRYALQNNLTGDFFFVVSEYHRIGLIFKYRLTK